MRAPGARRERARAARARGRGGGGVAGLSAAYLLGRRHVLAELGVEGQPSDMSFSVDCRRCRLQYSTRGVNGLFAQRRRALDPTHLRMLADVPRFGRLGLPPGREGCGVTGAIESGRS